VSWRQYQKFLKIVNKRDLSVLELGCGFGLNSLKIIKEYGGSATLVDYCDYALDNVKKEFQRAGLSATFLKEDFFDLKLESKFNLVHSEGVLEHFYDDMRVKAFEIHVNAMAEDGFLFIFVPTNNRSYRVFQRLLNFFGISVDEKPFTEDEFVKLVRKYNLEIVDNAKYLLFWRGFLIRNCSAN